MESTFNPFGLLASEEFLLLFRTTLVSEALGQRVSDADLRGHFAIGVKFAACCVRKLHVQQVECKFINGMHHKQ